MAILPTWGKRKYLPKQPLTFHSLWYVIPRLIKHSIQIIREHPSRKFYVRNHILNLSLRSLKVCCFAAQDVTPHLVGTKKKDQTRNLIWFNNFSGGCSVVGAFKPRRFWARTKRSALFIVSNFVTMWTGGERRRINYRVVSVWSA